MKKLIALLALAAVLLPDWASAQTASDTKSALKTGLWEGKWTYNLAPDSAVKVNVESVTGQHIKAQINFIDRQNAIVELTGDIVDSFGDFVEQSRWQFVIKDKKFKDGTWLKLTEVKVIQGNWDPKGTYYCFLTDGSIVGCWYYANDPTPRGRIELHSSEP